MDKESLLELQKLDCNCNDCKFMDRDQVRFGASEKLHHEWQLNEFENEKIRLSKEADVWYKKNELQKGYAVEQQISKMKFQFNRKECLINFGNCQKFNKPISFIPGIYQIETQNCFLHRKL